MIENESTHSLDEEKDVFICPYEDQILCTGPAHSSEMEKNVELKENLLKQQSLYSSRNLVNSLSSGWVGLGLGLE